jgi:hypothetical protein
MGCGSRSRLNEICSTSLEASLDFVGGINLLAQLSKGIQFMFFGCDDIEK